MTNITDERLKELRTIIQDDFTPVDLTEVDTIVAELLRAREAMRDSRVEIENAMAYLSNLGHMVTCNCDRCACTKDLQRALAILDKAEVGE